MMDGLLDLLGLPLLACVPLALLLGYLGLHVLEREIVFIDIALAQIVAVGVVASEVLLGAGAPALAGQAFPLAVTVLAAAFYAVVRRRVRALALEAVIGISYGVAAAAALLLLGVAPGGHVHVQHMLAGSILWASPADVGLSALVFALVGAVLFLCRRPIHRISDDYDAAVRAGLRVVAWDFLFYFLLGVVVAAAVRIAGVVLVFAFLIMPATLAALFTERVGRRVGIAWGAGLVAAAAGLLFAGRLDFSVGPAVALFLGVALGVGALFRVHPVAGALGAAGVAAGLVLLAVLDVGPGLPAGAQAGTGRPPRVPEAAAAPRDEEARSAAAAGRQPLRLRPEDVEDAEDIVALGALFARERAPDVRARIVRRLLALAPPDGIARALEFLESDPPLYFRQVVVEALGAVEPKAAGFEVTADAGAEVNRRTAAAIRAGLAGAK
ncbi:MAG: metal ABC transporter permease [Planctomycetes bacterium]|nr:metal ABC transporter permease [Planctomycetota bacterium]